jgi:hypothetical protein
MLRCRLPQVLSDLAGGTLTTGFPGAGIRTTNKGVQNEGHNPKSGSAYHPPRSSGGIFLYCLGAPDWTGFERFCLVVWINKMPDAWAPGMAYSTDFSSSNRLSNTSTASRRMVWST